MEKLTLSVVAIVHGDDESMDVTETFIAEAKEDLALGAADAFRSMAELLEDGLISAETLRERASLLLTRANRMEQRG